MKLRDEIASSIEGTLVAQARANELRVAWVRVTATAVVTAFNVAGHLDPAQVGLSHYPLRNAIVSGSFMLLSLALVWILRGGWYRPLLGTLSPALDACVVLVLFAGVAAGIDAASLARQGATANCAAVLALLAASGGLRLRRGAAAVSTLAALATWVIASRIAELTLTQTAFVFGSVAAAGLLGWWMSDLARRSAEGAVARSMLTRFLPTKVVDAAHHDPLALVSEGKTMDVTIVVTDLRGFTAMAETMAPADVLRFLNTVQGRLAAAVHAHGGTIDKFLGDGMLAVFGAPEPLADHATCALDAVHDMLRAVDDAGRVKLGIGVHSGPVVAGCIGDGARLEFTVIGDTVNTASRLESLTKEKGVAVLVSGETARRLRAAAAAALAPLGNVTLRGRNEPLAIHALQG